MEELKKLLISKDIEITTLREENKGLKDAAERGRTAYINLANDNKYLKYECGVHEERVKELEIKSAQAITLLSMTTCPLCDGRGVHQVSEEDWEPCQWCDEKAALIPQPEEKESNDDYDPDLPF